MCADFAALGTWGHEGSRSVIPKMTYPGLVEIVEATGEYAPKLFDQDSFLERALTSGVVRGDFSVDDDVVVGSRGADMPATAMLRSFSFNNIHATVGQLFSPAVNDNPILLLPFGNNGIIHFQAGLERPQHEVIGSEEDKSDY